MTILTANWTKWRLNTISQSFAYKKTVVITVKINDLFIMAAMQGVGTRHQPSILAGTWDKLHTHCSWTGHGFPSVQTNKVKRGQRPRLASFTAAYVTLGYRCYRQHCSCCKIDVDKPSAVSLPGSNCKLTNAICCYTLRVSTRCSSRNTLSSYATYTTESSQDEGMNHGPNQAQLGIDPLLSHQQDVGGRQL